MGTPQEVTGCNVSSVNAVIALLFVHGNALCCRSCQHCFLPGKVFACLSEASTLTLAPRDFRLVLQGSFRLLLIIGARDPGAAADQEPAALDGRAQPAHLHAGRHAAARDLRQGALLMVSN